MKRLYSINMWSTPAVWKQYNKMAVLHFFLVNSPLIYILFFLPVTIQSNLGPHSVLQLLEDGGKPKQTSNLSTGVYIFLKNHLPPPYFPKSFHQNLGMYF